MEEYISLKDVKDKKVDLNLHNKQYIESMLIQYKDYFDNMYKGVDDSILLDEEQRVAILTDDDYNLIVAGAGSGKTTTMAAKVKFLVDIKRVNPNDIILISYTNKAVEELQKRINEDFKIPVLVCTFHKFGMEVLKKCGKLNLQVLTNPYFLIRKYFDEYLCSDNKVLKEFLEFFTLYFDIPSFALKFKSLNDYLSYKKKSNFLILKNKINDKIKKYPIDEYFFKTNEEIMVANFLYLNSINYEYYKSYPYLDTYHPDFTIYQNDKIIYLEIFNLNSFNDIITNFRYKYSIDKIRKIHKKNQTTLIEVYVGDDILSNLKEQLIKNDIIFNQKSYREIYNKLIDNRKDIYYERFINFCINFIQGFKVNGYSKEDFVRLKENSDKRTNLFLEFIEAVYDYYNKQLLLNNYIDFEDMINLAYLNLDKIILNYKYIIIDEYQDISKQRFNLAKKISEVSNAKIIAVGDDFQSIFAFAGSDISLFTDFKDKMGYATLLKITHTYRNSQELINIAGKFVMTNKKQIKKKLVSPKKLNKPVVVLVYDDFKDKIKLINDCLKEFDDKQKILLIGRYNFEKNHLLNSGEFSESNNKIISKKYPNLNIEFLSAHSSKGLGYDQVIILNGEDDVYGFPSKIKDDPIMKLININDISYAYAEERRLFYVALTRTKNRVYILASEKNPSKFILEISRYNEVEVRGKLLNKSYNCPKCGFPLIKMHGLYVCSNEKELCNFKTNNLKYMKNIIKCPRCNGYLIVKKGQPDFIGCTNYIKGCDYKEKL